MDLATVIGMLGVSGILIAYFLNLFHHITQDSFSYISMNIVGSGLACLSSIMIDSLPFTILEGTWCLVSVFALAKKLKTN